MQNQLLAQHLVFWLQQNECSYNKNYVGATATGVVTISSGDELSLQSAVANVGPVSTYVDASQRSFQVSEMHTFVKAIKSRYHHNFTTERRTVFSE